MSDFSPVAILLLMKAKPLALLFLAIVSVWLLTSIVRFYVFTRRASRLISSTVPYSRQSGAKGRILVLGDSLAYGTGTSRPENSVAGLVASEFPDFTVENMSRNGKRTNELAQEINKIEGNYELILVIIGGNDALRPWINLKASGQNLQEIYGKASKHAKQVVVLTTSDLKYTTFFLWPLNFYFSKRSNYLRESAKRAAAGLDNVRYVDLIERNQTVQFDHDEESNDHLHLNDAGARYWFEAIRETTDDFQFN